MIRRLVPAAAAVALLALPSISSSAGDPSPAHCTVPAHINLIGLNPQTGFSYIDPTGAFLVTVRDVNDDPVQNKNVFVFLTGCSETIPSSLQIGAGNTPCSNQMIVAQTDNNGVALFNILGSTLHRQAGQVGSCASVFADGSSSTIHIGDMTVAAFDEDGIKGVRGMDLRYFLCDFFSATNPQRSDFNGIGGINAADLSLWLSEYFSIKASVNTAPRCDLVDPGNGAALTPGQLYMTAANGGVGTCVSSGGSTTIAPDCLGGNITRIVASFTPTAAIPSAAAFEAELELTGPTGSPLPDFWRLDAPGCNSGFLTPRSLFGNVIGPTGCPFAFRCGTGPWSVTMVNGLFMECPYPGTTDDSRARIRIVGTVNPPSTCAPPLSAATQYTLFGLDLDPSNDGTCSGCNTNVALKLVSVRINAGPFDCTQPAKPSASLEGPAVASDDLLFASSSSDPATVVFFNGTPAGYNITGVPHPAGHSAASLGAAEPNPSSGSFHVRYRLARSGVATLSVHDVSGRLVRSLTRGWRAAGDYEAEWDGSGDDGAKAAGGVYFLRFNGPDGSSSRALVRVR